jgi:hypothetical protein
LQAVHLQSLLSACCSNELPLQDKATRKENFDDDLSDCNRCRLQEMSGIFDVPAEKCAW